MDDAMLIYLLADIGRQRTLLVILKPCLYGAYRAKMLSPQVWAVGVEQREERLRLVIDRKVSLRGLLTMSLCSHMLIQSTACFILYEKFNIPTFLKSQQLFCEPVYHVQVKMLPRLRVGYSDERA
jgi:hypothetical protein